MTFRPFIVITPACFGTSPILEDDVVQRIRAELVLAGIEEVQARHREPAVVGQQDLLALGVEGLERGFVVGALRGGRRVATRVRTNKLMRFDSLICVIRVMFAFQRREPYTIIAQSSRPPRPRPCRRRSSSPSAAYFLLPLEARYRPYSERGLPVFFARSARNTRSASAKLPRLDQQRAKRSRSGFSQSGGSL